MPPTILVLQSESSPLVGCASSVLQWRGRPVVVLVRTVYGGVRLRTISVSSSVYCVHGLSMILPSSLRPPLQHPDVQLVYVQVPDLFQSLLLTVCGTSSHLHIWDSSLQKFVLRNLQGRKRGEIVIVSKDEVLSARFVSFHHKSAIVCLLVPPAYSNDF